MKGMGQREQRGKHLVVGAGRGIPHPLHSEEAFQKFLQAPVGTQKVAGWLAPATRERLTLLRGDVTLELWAALGSQSRASTEKP